MYVPDALAAHRNIQSQRIKCLTLQGPAQQYADTSSDLSGAHRNTHSDRKSHVGPFAFEIERSAFEIERHTFEEGHCAIEVETLCCAERCVRH